MDALRDFEHWLDLLSAILGLVTAAKAIVFSRRAQRESRRWSIAIDIRVSRSEPPEHSRDRLTTTGEADRAVNIDDRQSLRRQDAIGVEGFGDRVANRQAQL